MAEKDRGKEKLDLARQIIVFIGPEGSGKTTHALRLAEEASKPYLSTGDILRDLAANDFLTPYGDACRKMFAEHAYLDGQTLLEILILRLGRADMADGFVMDGSMRTVEETIKLQEVLNSAGRGDLLIKVIQLEITEEESLARLAGESGRKRFDDTVEAIRIRLSKYQYQLEQRLEIIRSHPNWQLIPVNAMPDTEEVYLQVQTRLRDLS